MEGEWPLVGRAAELDRVASLLRRGAGGLVLAGPAGVGKTRLAGECLALAAAAGYVPLRVAATQAAGTLPFGAFSGLLPELTAGTDRSEVLRQVRRSIVERGEGKPIALLVDDAHLLDEGSAALTHQLAAGQETFVVATIRSGESASDAVVALWKDGLAERLELAPFTLEQVDELLGTVLGGPADGASVRELWQRTEGNVLFLKELVVGAREAGVLRDDAGIWRLHGRLPASNRLVELVEGRLAGLAEVEREVLEVLALGEPLGVDLVGQRMLRVLERRGLLRIEEDGRRLQARLAHPLYGDVLRSRLSPLRRRALSCSLADATIRAGVRRRDDVLRVATWTLDGGVPPQPATMLQAAWRALTLYDMQLAERAVVAALDAGAGFPAELLLARLMGVTGRGAEAEDHLSALCVQGLSDAERGKLAVTRIENLCFNLGRLEDALAVIDEAEAAIGDSAWRDEITAGRITALYLAGDTTGALQLAEPFLERATDRAFHRALLSTGFGYTTSGRLSDAVALADLSDRRRSFPSAAMPWALRSRVAIQVFSSLVAGHLHEVEVLIDQGYEKALREGSAELQTWFAFARSRLCLQQGRVASAVRWGREAAALALDRGRNFAVRWIFHCLGQALALSGRPDEATEALAQLDTLPLASLRDQEAEADRARGWISVARGDLDMARQHLAKGAATATTSGDFAIEAAALHDLARLGRATDVAPRLAELAQIVEGPLAPARAGHATALVANDPVALEAASVAFDAMDASLLAAEAAADAAVAWRKGGDPRKAAAAERRAHMLADRCEGARTPALTPITARAALSARELEIARLAAAGAPNKEIAERLYLSLHTVQNKLHSAYEKLGIEGRAELAEALEQY